jgi:hypothetical protein
MTVPIKIRAVREDPSNPILECYRENPIGLAKLLATRTTIQPTTTKTKANIMSLNPEYVSASSKPATKHAVSGIGPSGDPARLIGVLANLGLCPHELATPLKQLAAAGKPLKEFYQVSVWDLDRALQNVDCSIQNRMQFKASLDRAGLLSVPK